MAAEEQEQWNAAITAALKAAPERSLTRKKLRKRAMEACSVDRSDKQQKKAARAVFAAALAALVARSKVVHEAADDVVTYNRTKRGGKAARGKRGADEAFGAASAATGAAAAKQAKVEEVAVGGGAAAAASASHPSNTSGCTRLFVGNLNWKIDEATLDGALGSCITHYKWITDRETGQFYGTCFVEVRTAAAAAAAVQLAGTKVMGRPVKIEFSPPRPGDVWPPVEGTWTKAPNVKDNKKDRKIAPIGKPEAPQPEGCRKLFAGNLSYNITDELVNEFFKECGEIEAIRWLTHRDSGDFKGCGYIQFYDADACAAAAELNGSMLMGRQLRLDWAD